MSRFTDLFVDRERDARRLREFTAQQQQEGAQQIISQAQGTPELPGPVRGAQNLGGIPAVPGIGALPPGDQQAAFAQIVATTPGFETGGISMFSQALQARAMRVQNQQQFEVTDTRLGDQFSEKLEQDHDQWLVEQGLRDAKRNEDADMHVLKMQLTEAQIDAAGASSTAANQAKAIALAKFQRLTPADQVLTQTMANNLFRMQNNINIFDDSYAVDTIIPGKGELELLLLRNKKGKTKAELEKVQFWTDVELYEQYFGKELSGAEISDSQREAIRRLIPAIGDDADTIQQKMRGLHRETARILGSVQERLKVEGFRDIGFQFGGALPLPPLPDPDAAQPGDPPPPPGFS